jgi:osmotically-inducible protein OsmY
LEFNEMMLTQRFAHHFVTAVLLVMVIALGGCVAAAVGGAAAGGYLVGEDRRAANVLAEDEGIELRASSSISEKFPAAHINSTSYNRLVLLTGEAPSAQAKTEIERIVRGLPNVRGTFDEIAVGPATALSSRTNDSYITSKVKARFVDAQKFNPVHIKVVTENSVVYLMGIVKQQEADAATEIARTTSGVRRVVRVFEYQS